MRSTIVPLLLVAVTFLTGCTSTGIKNQKVLAQSTGQLTPPLAVTVTMNDQENADLKPVIIEAVTKQLKKQGIATVPGSSASFVDITVESMQRVGHWKRRWLGNMAPADKLDVVIKWSDGSTVRETATTKLAYANSGHIEDAIDELARSIAKQTRAKLGK